MKKGSTKPVRCAIYTRVSTEHGLEQDFNSLDAQHDAAQAYIRSQAHAGWALIRTRYDDGGYSGGWTDRPALQRLLADVKAGKIDVIVVYKVDRLTRSLADFAKLVLAGAHQTIVRFFCPHPHISARNRRDALTRSDHVSHPIPRYGSGKVRRKRIEGARGSLSNACASLPGTPDFANKSRRWALFVHGCFWHS